MTPHSPQPRWSREQIRAARLAPLVPLLQKRALQLIEQPAGNFLLPAYPGLIVKDCYWRWPERNLARPSPKASARQEAMPSTFFAVLGLSFHDAMRQITAMGPKTDYYRWRRLHTTPVRLESQEI